ncbi:MAG: UvrD-helicase domain-containing protein [Erysipelotrichaceae bacterium]
MMRFDDQQSRAINTIDRNVLVSASAGSGKTAALTYRLASLIIDHRVKVNEILALTFTKNAAAEMRLRVEKHLLKFLDDHDDDFVKEQLDLLPSAYITTIDSFCLSLVKENYSLLDLPYDYVYNTLSQIVDKQLYEEAFNELLMKYHDDDSFRSFVLSYQSNVTNFDSILDLLKDIINTAFSSVDPTDWFIRAKDNYRLVNDHLVFMDEMQLEFFSKFKADSIKLLERIIDNTSISAKLKKGCENRLSLLKSTNFMIMDKYQIKDFVFSYFNILEVGKSSKCLETTSLAKLDEMFLKTYHEKDNDVLLSVYANYFLDLSKELYDLTLSKRMVYPGINFMDMSTFALLLLSEHEDVRQRYVHQIKYIMVDEYQDTSQIQDHIIGLLSNGHNMFKVGDIKQAIYGFRNADCEIFNRYLNDPNYEVIRFVNNYRSDGKIVQGVNQIFDRLLNVPGTNMRFSEEDYAHAFKAKSDRACISFVGVSDEDCVQYCESHPNVSKVMALKIIKYQRIIDGIKGLHASGVAYGDIAILNRSNESSMMMKVMFDNCRIPIKMRVKGSYKNSHVLMMVYNLLGFVSDVSNDLYLVPILNKLLGVSYDDIMTWKIDGLWSMMSEDIKGVLNQWLHDYQKLNLLSWLWQVLSTNDYLSSLSEYETIALYDLMDVYLNYEAISNSSKVDFKDYLTKLIDESEDSEKQFFSSGNDFVKYETIHGSKGKEYKYVFMIGNDSVGKGIVSKGIVDVNEGLALKGVDGPYRLTYNNYFYYHLLNKNKMKDSNEELRLLYVALTRSENHFYYVGRLNDDVGDLNYDFLMDNLNYYRRLKLGLDDKVTLYDYVEFEHTLVGDDIVDGPTLLASSLKAKSSSVKADLAPSNHGLVKYQLINNAGLLFGTRVHLLASKMVHTRSKVNDPYVDKLFDQDFFQRLLKEYECHSEYPYYVTIDNHYQNGIIDFLAIKDNEIVIVDFKTDKLVNKGDFVTMYKQQLLTYCGIMERIYNNYQVKAFVYSFNLDVFIEVI